MKLIVKNSTITQEAVNPVIKKYAKNLVSTSSTDGGFMQIPVKISTSDTITAKIRFNSATTQDFLISAETSHLLNVCSSTGFLRVDYCSLLFSGTGEHVPIGEDLSLIIKTDYIVAISPNSRERLYWNEGTPTQYTNELTNIRIFRMPDIGHQWFSELLITDNNGNKKHDIVPAVIGEDSCLYDKITKGIFISDKIECFDS